MVGLLFIVGIYLFARGVFALFGQPIFYTKRSLEPVDPELLPAYLKEEGIWNMASGFLFTAKAILEKAFPGNMVIWVAFVVLLLVCVYFLAKCNEKYLKK